MMARTKVVWRGPLESRSALAAEGPEQLDDLLRVPPGFARPGAVTEPVQFLADLKVCFARVPQLPGPGGYLGIGGLQVRRYDGLGGARAGPVFPLPGGAVQGKR
jgi:hypothetical protein